MHFDLAHVASLAIATPPSSAERGLSRDTPCWRITPSMPTMAAVTGIENAKGMPSSPAPRLFLPDTSRNLHWKRLL